MFYRSWLIATAGSERALAGAAQSGADAVVVDLAELPVPDARLTARAMAAEWLRAHRERIVENEPAGRWVRISPLYSRTWRDDLIAVMPHAPEGILLPGAGGPDDVRHLASEIYELEQRHHIAPGATKILPSVGEGARAAMTLSSYIEAPHQRLAGLTWSAPALALGIGASRVQTGKVRRWTDAFAFVRAQALLAAHACGLMAIETAHFDIGDARGLKAAARDARADGFTGMLALHADQVAAINEAFTPSDEELEDARAVVAAFDGDIDPAALPVDRRAIDPAMLAHARRLLGMAGVGAPGAPRQPVLRPA